MIDSETLEATLGRAVEEFLDAAEEGALEHGDGAVAYQLPDSGVDGPDQSVSGSRRTRTREELASESFEKVRALLDDELTVVSRLQGSDAIAQSEQQREIAKGALATLRKPELQRAARSLSLSKSGSKAELLNRLVEHIGVTPEAIAKLVSVVERRPSEGRRHAARLFAFSELPPAAELTTRLQPFEGRYVRTDLARWFVVDEVDGSADAVGIHGRLRTYDIDVAPGRLDAHQKNFSVQLHRHDAEPILRAYSRLEPESVAAVEAFGLFVGQLPQPPLSQLGGDTSWDSAGLDPQTAWLLGVLLGLLDNPTMTLEDVTSASFEKPKRGAAAIGAQVPHVGSARLRGQHVLDSPSACRHLASNERLGAVTAMVRFRRTDNREFVSLPVRLAATQHYVAVMTGFGLAGVEESRNLHRNLEDHIVGQLIAPTIELEHLKTTVEAMLDRARDTEPPEVANLFARAKRGAVQVEGRSVER